MKKALTLILLLTAVSQISLGQNQKFDGYWLGQLKTMDKCKVPLILKIEGNIARQMTYNDQDGLQLVDHRVKEYTQSLRNNLCYTWLNMGDGWSETQTFMITYLNPEKLQVLWIKQVNNIQEDANENDVWFVIGRGNMKKLSHEELGDLAAY